MGTNQTISWLACMSFAVASTLVHGWDSASSFIAAGFVITGLAGRRNGN